MRKLFTSICCTFMTLAALAASPAQRERNVQSPFRFAPRATTEMRDASFGRLATFEQATNKGAAKISVSKEAVLHTLPTGDESGYLIGPGGETWFYSAVWDKEIEKHEYYTETIIKGYKITIYNEAFEEIGIIEDDITLEEGEVKVAQVMVGGHITKKFFNVDSNYEIMIGLACNTIDYTNNYRTLVYSIGNNEPIITIPGYYISAVNTATDAWSEKFWITFITEEDTQTPTVGNVMNTMDYRFRVYKYAGYNGLGDPVLDLAVPGVTVSGENAIPFLAKVRDGKPYFAINRMKYCWYEDPFNYENENPTPDNELVIDLYTLPSAFASTPEKYSTTTVKSGTTSDDIYFMYLGNFRDTDDIDFDLWSENGNPALVITREHLTMGGDDYDYDYSVYDAAAQGETAEGVHRLDIATGVSGGVFMNDIPGFDPQVMFIVNENNEYTFHFVNIRTGELEHLFPYQITEDINFTAATDRIPHGNSYIYTVPLTHGMSDPEGNTYTGIAFVTTDGKLDHYDSVNLGQDVQYAVLYTQPDAFNPYIFNLDDEREYMALVKRGVESGGNREELMVVSTDMDKEPLLTLVPDENLGSLSFISFANLETSTPRLIVAWVKDWQYTMTAYELPFTLFEQGEGTAENPYLISTAGGLKQIKSKPDAHYLIVSDIDASGMTIANESFEFKGSIDGQNHLISNLTLNGRALLPYVTRKESAGENDGVIKNIKFVSPKLLDAKDAQGVLAGTVTNGVRISNVHIYGAEINSEDGDIGGLVGCAYLYSTIEGCSVDADITSPEGSVGGIVSRIRTTSAVNACSFTGTIHGGTDVGGIVGSIDNAEDRVSDCHVKANIKARNTIGGIAGSSSRGIISRCHVEGTLEATEAPRWGGGMKLGGIVGQLQQSFAQENTRAVTPVIESCFVNLSAMTAGEVSNEETFAGQNDTHHRIVGATSVNNEPEAIDYDENWEPIYGDPQPAEAGLANNYVISTLPRVNEAIQDATNSTEGKSIDASELSMSFFMELGFSYGYDIESPWNMTGDQTRPTLYFEGGLLLFSPAAVTAGLDENVTLRLTLVGGEFSEDMFDDFSMEVSDESVLEMTDMGFEDGAILLTFKALQEGEVVVKAYIAGKQAECAVTVVYSTAVDKVVAENPLSYGNGTVKAQGCAIVIYNTLGAKVMAGYDSCDTASLPAGIYIAKATRADGTKAAIKFIVK